MVKSGCLMGVGLGNGVGRETGNFYFDFKLFVLFNFFYMYVLIL